MESGSCVLACSVRTLQDVASSLLASNASVTPGVKCFRHAEVLVPVVTLLAVYRLRHGNSSDFEVRKEDSERIMGPSDGLVSQVGTLG